MKHLVCTTITGAVLLLSTTAAQAYHEGQSFELSANDGGGGGLYFTGSPVWKRYDCSICHVDPPGAIAIELESTPPELIEQGVWHAGQTYELLVRMVGETRGLSAQSNINTFLADFSDSAGNAVGAVFTESDTTRTFGDGWVIGARADQNQTEWRFRFTPPVPGSGAISLHVAVVDGDGGGNPSSRIVDTVDDDVAVETIVFCERGASPCDGSPGAGEAADSVVTSGCTSSRHGAPVSVGPVILALIFACGQNRKSSGVLPRARC